MTRIFALVLLLLSPSVLAQFQNFPTRSELRTSSALNLYVATTGSDSNSCRSVGKPCLTLAGAVRKIPKTTRHGVLITMGQGNFAGANITGFHFDAGSGPAYIAITGPLITATPATGSATGTATSGTAGTASTSTWGTLTMTGAGWTTDNLRGKLVEITGGTGSGQLKMISGNTADTLTISGNWTAPNNTSTFAIRDWGTVFNTSVAGMTSYYTSGLTTVLRFDNTGVGGSYDNHLFLEKVKITTSANAGVMVAGTATLTTKWVAIDGPQRSFSIYSAAGAGGAVRVYDSFLNASSSAAFSNNQAEQFAYVQNNVVIAPYGWSSGTSGSRITSYMNLWRTSITAFDMNAKYISSIGDNVTCTAGDGYEAVSTFASQLVGYAHIQGGQINSCGTAVRVSGAQRAVLSNVAGTGNTTVLTMSYGGAAQVSSNSTIAGTTEVTMDGTNHTFATMRGTTPKLLKSDYGTMFFE